MSDALQLWAFPIGAEIPLEGNPVVRSGVHLRWSVSSTRGLPWGGYYLLRRQLAGSPSLTGEAYKGSFAPIRRRWHAVRLYAESDEGQQPIALPVDHPDYPPAHFVSAVVGNVLETAKQRVIVEGDPTGRLQAALDRLTATSPDSDGAELTAMLSALVAGGMWSTPMVDRQLPADAYDARAGGTADNSVVPVLPSLLDAVLLPAAYPTYAQFLGLYAVDQLTGQESEVEYALIADHTCKFVGSTTDALLWAEAGFQSDPGLEFARVTVKIGKEWAVPLSAPAKCFTYLLPPGPPAQEQGPYDVVPKAPSIGLTWESMPLLLGDGSPLWPVLYQIQRAKVGAATVADWQNPGKKTTKQETWESMLPEDVWHLSTGRIEPLGAEPVEDAIRAGETVAYPLDPARPPVAMAYIDDTVEEAWYAYRVRTQDWFGRMSDWSDRAAWKTWPRTASKTEPPWYHKFADQAQVIHKHFVLAADGGGPQGPPFAVEQLALVGGGATATVRWRWSWADFRQSPISPQFRIYARPGRSNVYRGTLVAAAFVDPVSPSSVVSLHCALPTFTGDANLLRGSTLRMSGLGLLIALVDSGSKPAKFICVLPKNKSIADLQIGAPCSVVVPEGQSAWQDPNNVRLAPWTRLPQSATRTAHLSFEVFRATTTLPLQGEVVSGRVAELLFTVDKEVELDYLAANAPNMDFQVTLADEQRWTGKLLSCAPGNNTLVVKVLVTKPWGGTNQPTKWRIGYSTASSFEVADLKPGVPASGLLPTNATVIGYEVALGGLIPLDGVQPGAQSLSLKSTSGSANVHPIVACDPVSRTITIRPTAGQAPPAVWEGLQWQIGGLNGGEFTVAPANVGQPLYGPVTAASGKTLMLGGPAPLDGVFPGLWSLMLAPMQAPGQPKLSDGKVYRLDTVKIAARAATLTDEPAPPAGKKLTDLYWFLGQPVYEFEEKVTLPVGLVSKASDSGKVTFEFAVTAADQRSYIPDWIGSNSPLAQPGAEGPPSSIAVATADVVVTPPTLQLPASVAVRQATAPDINGRSFATIRWPKSVADKPVYAMAVLRASADAVFLAKARVDGTPNGAVDAALVALWAKSVAEQVALAAAPEVLSSYAPVSSAPLLTAGQPAKVGPDDPPGYAAPTDQVAYVDTLDGRVPGLWFYRLQPYDAQGQAGAVVPGAIAVRVTGEDRPAAPVLVSAWFGTDAEHEQLAGATSAQELLDTLATIQKRTISLAWTHNDPQGRSWVVELVSEDGQQRLRKELGIKPVVDGKVAANLEVPSGGRWQVSVAAVSKSTKSTSAASLGRVVAVPG